MAKHILPILSDEEIERFDIAAHKVNSELKSVPLEKVTRGVLVALCQIQRDADEVILKEKYISKEKIREVKDKLNEQEAGAIGLNPADIKTARCCRHKIDLCNELLGEK